MCLLSATNERPNRTYVMLMESRNVSCLVSSLRLFYKQFSKQPVLFPSNVKPKFHAYTKLQVKLQFRYLRVLVSDGKSEWLLTFHQFNLLVMYSWGKNGSVCRFQRFQLQTSQCLLATFIEWFCPPFRRCDTNKRMRASTLCLSLSILDKSPY